MTRLRREWKCNYCDCVFDSSTKLRKHKKENHTEECKNHIINLNISKRNPNGWICNYCGKKFDAKHILYEHIHIVHANEYKANKIWECQYCHQIISSRTMLYEHYKICKEKLKLPHDSKGRIISEIAHKHIGETLHKKYASGELIHKKLQCSPETRAKLAEKMRKRKNIIDCQCNYNETACKFIDELNIKNNWNLQHAMNGGEYKIGPYHVDGYDKELNIVFEYDEKQSRHTQIKGILRDKYRQAYIIEKLNCEFWRYSERDNLLYKVDKLKNLEEIKILQEQYPNIKIRKFEKKQKIKAEKLVKLKKEKKPKIKKESIYPKDKSGKGNPNIISEEIWIERKNLILNCGIDLMKFGWVGKVKKLTGLTQRELENTLEHFESEFNGKYFRRKITDTP